MAKSFKKNPAINFLTENNKNTQDVQEVRKEQEVSEVQQEQKVQEAQQVEKNLTSKNTQGRKGHKLPRINMGFYGDNLENARKISRFYGISITEYMNRLIYEDIEKNKDILEQLEKLEKLKK